jgi:hypothetical protein
MSFTSPIEPRGGPTKVGGKSTEKDIHFGGDVEHQRGSFREIEMDMRSTTLASPSPYHTAVDNSSWDCEPQFQQSDL